MCYNTELQNVQPQISKFIRSRVYNPNDASDVIQNTNIVLLNKRDDFDEGKPFTPWAMRIASFQIKAFLSKVKRNKIELYDEEWKMDEVYYEEAFCNTKERIKYLKEIQKQIGVGRKKLTGREDEVLSLTLEGHRLVDISAKLNIKSAHACVYRQRAILKIKDFIKKRKLKML